MLLVLERGVHRQLQHAAQRRPDLHAHSPAVCRLVPASVVRAWAQAPERSLVQRTVLGVQRALEDLEA